ncbi:hypothetical protein [Cellulomonas palmilytica]|nr:hypothetical protein [Cellulomonas palmilytica]
MQPLEAARAHLRKARQFLDAADVELSGELHDAAAAGDLVVR